MADKKRNTAIIVSMFAVLCVICVVAAVYYNPAQRQNNEELILKQRASKRLAAQVRRVQLSELSVIPSDVLHVAKYIEVKANSVMLNNIDGKVSLPADYLLCELLW